MNKIEEVIREDLKVLCKQAYEVNERLYKAICEHEELSKKLVKQDLTLWSESQFLKAKIEYADVGGDIEVVDKDKKRLDELSKILADVKKTNDDLAKTNGELRTLASQVNQLSNIKGQIEANIDHKRNALKNVQDALEAN